MYNDLYKAWKAEKTNTALQPLPEDFFKRTQTYVQTLDENSRKTNSNTLQDGLILKEKEISGRLLAELRETRLKKLMDAAKNTNQVPSTLLTDEEKILIDNLEKSLHSFVQSDGGERAITPDTSEILELKVVRFVQDIPEIVGVDLKMYGPYKKEDIASIPEQNAQALIKQGAAKAIEVRGVV